MADGNLRYRKLKRPQRRRTETWEVTSAHGGGLLGYISWHAPWRRYTFRPAAATLYDPACLRELADKCQAETETRKARRKAERTRAFLKEAPNEV